MKAVKTLKAKKQKSKIIGIIEKEFRPKEWLRKNEEDKQVQCYFYVKKKNKEYVMLEIDSIIKKYK